jgi:Transposase IS4
MVMPSLKNWSDISVLTDFFAFLFIASIQKRKDRNSNWWSDNPLLENVAIKQIMSGKKFHKIMRFLHVSLMENQPRTTDPTYDPAYKVKELQDLLQERYEKLYITGRYLSLDETLVRAFGHIKFKVRIVTKSERYGIKLYVVTDAETALSFTPLFTLVPILISKIRMRI